MNNNRFFHRLPSQQDVTSTTVLMNKSYKMLTLIIMLELLIHNFYLRLKSFLKSTYLIKIADSLFIFKHREKL